MFLPNNEQSYHFIIIGCGGTGGYLIEHLARLLNAKAEAHAISLVDGDRVEEKNLLRQSFYVDDLGLNKAESLGNRIIKTYPHLTEENVLIAPAYLKNETEIHQLLDYVPNALPIIIGAVDNNSTRRLIDSALANYEKPVLWLDAGNNLRNGQVFTSSFNTESLETSSDAIQNKDFPSHIQDFPESFPEDGLHPSDISCAEHVESAPQAMIANVFAGDLLFALANKLLNGEALTKREIKFDTASITLTEE